MVSWQEECLAALGNKIEKFVALEDDWESKVDHRYASGIGLERGDI